MPKDRGTRRDHLRLSTKHIRGITGCSQWAKTVYIRDQLLLIGLVLRLASIQEPWEATQESSLSVLRVSKEKLAQRAQYRETEAVWAAGKLVLGSVNQM